MPINGKSVAIISDSPEFDLAKQRLSNLIYKSGGAPMVATRSDGAEAVADIVVSDVIDPVQGADLYMRTLFDGRFLMLDKSANPELMDITDLEFEPDKVSEEPSQNFYRNLKKRYGQKFEYPYPIEDFVLIILDPTHDSDGKEREYSNNDMIAHTLAAQEFREVIIWGENGQDIPWQYRDTLSALHEVDRVSFSTGNIDRLLDQAHLVVSQSSDVGLRAHLHKTHVIYFDEYPFHHLMRGPKKDGRLAKSFNRIGRDLQRQEKYMFWLLKKQFADLESNGWNKKVKRQLRNCGLKFD